MKIIPKRRRRESKTNYLKRKRLLEGKKPRVVVRKTNRYIIIQFVESKLAQDRILAGVTSKKLLAYGWPENKAGSLKGLAAGYLTGILFGTQYYFWYFIYKHEDGREEVRYRRPEDDKDTNKMISEIFKLQER